MQTFLPYGRDFAATARILDRQRLGKQRVECVQIANVLIGDKTGYANHPAVKMWRGHGVMLCHYGMIICEEWWNRGYTDNQFDVLDHLQTRFFGLGDTSAVPWWLEQDEHANYLAMTHQANLKRKDPKYYSRFFPAVDPRLGYWWPVK
jgi:hypothetical protein